jgi:hypothetical protein
VGVGSAIHITEMLDARSNYLVDVETEIVKLDETGFAHRPRFHGLRVAQMDYEFHATDQGTQYYNSLTVGIRGVAGRLVNPFIRRFAFDESRGLAWVKHNIEEVGNFESFLPALYTEAQEAPVSTTLCSATE